jgi:hypothetical protein
VSKVVLDDHLLRDLLADSASSELKRLLRRSTPCTTNLYVYRLAKSVVAARGRQLTGRWTQAQRIALGRELVEMPPDIEVVPLQQLTMNMAELAEQYRLSTLGAEAVAAAQWLRASLAVWDGDDGPGIRRAAETLSIRYRTVSH